MEIARKAYQISYILIRFSQNVDSDSQFRKSVYDLAISLMVEVNQKQIVKAIETLTTLQWLFRLAADAGLMPLSDAESVIEECYQLAREIDAIEVSHQAIWLSHSSFAQFFKEASQLKGVPLEHSKDRKEDKKTEVETDRLATINRESRPPKIEASTRTSLGTRDRQEKILDFIRQQTAKSEIAVCRLKDLQTSFSGVSERTLRYDLQKLMDEGRVERLGGGPTSAYRLSKQLLPPTVTS
ncbi:MAG: DeoR family transcriptional regulator [Anaplasmataceae bacterium]|nr:DeoR family transcriptional regulator [Anaplasmataceae bacterium]